MKTHKFARKPFYVDAVRVTEANMEEVARWCKGKILEDATDGKYISVKVHHPLNDKQTMAFVGHWVLFAGNGYKVYPPKAFDKSFEKVKTLTKEQADEAGIKVPHEPRQPKKPLFKSPANPVLSKEAVEKIKAAPKPIEGSDRSGAPLDADQDGVIDSLQDEGVATKDEADKLIDEVLNGK